MARFFVRFMARFFVRMELHKKPGKKVEEDEYKTLHEEMAKKEFYPKVEYDNDSNVYQLPTGSYRKVADQTIEEANKNLIDAGNETVRRSVDVESFSFFLTEYSNSRKHKLKVIPINGK